MLIYGVAVISSVDNFIKPILMSRAGNLSMLAGGPRRVRRRGRVRLHRALRRPGAPRGRLEPHQGLARARTRTNRTPRRNREGARPARRRASPSSPRAAAATPWSSTRRPTSAGATSDARPMELVLMGTGACSAIDVVLHPAQGAPAGHGLRGRAGCRARRRTIPKVFTKIHFHYVVTGNGLAPRAGRARDQALEGQVLLGDRSCSPRPRQITSDFEIREAYAPQTQYAVPRHHLRCDAHRRLHRRRKLGRAERATRRRRGAVSSSRICIDDRAAAEIVARQSLEMSLEVALDLRFGLGEEAHAPAIAGDAGNDAERERTRIPERIEQTRARTQLGEAPAAPREVVALLARRLPASTARTRSSRATSACPL